MKLALGGSAVIATALLTASFVFYAPSSTALSQTLLKKEINQEQVQNKTEQENNNVNIKTENNKNEKSNKHTTPNDRDNKSAEPISERLAKAESYSATAYALRGRTASGRNVSKGIIAADPRVLPLGSKVRVEAGNWSGEYVVADTGGKIKGKKIDIWVPNNSEATRFGRRTVKVTVLSYGKRPAVSSKKVQSTVKTKQKKK